MPKITTNIPSLSVPSMKNFFNESVKARTPFHCRCTTGLFLPGIKTFYDVFLPTRGQRLVLWIKPLTVQSLDGIPS